MRIAILEDEAVLAEQLSGVLERAGHICYCHNTGKKLIAVLKRETFDLLILDWNLPDTTGLEVLGWVREHIDHAPPVLFVTSRGEERDIVEALNMGADDYVVKPVQTGEVLARVGALFRRSYPSKGKDIEAFENYRFEQKTTSVMIGEEQIVLTPKEFGLALLLFQNLDRALSRAYILEKVWGRNPDLLTRTLDAHISRIRVKLALRPETGFRLLPVYSYGYRLERLNGGEGQ
ncbi:response regulator transcription factor [Sphingomonas bacterium]|uniref:response regulator transcription factor n=1 Tax=Sphingomonas bacterium TaxID=1895847 RepID=UPI0015761A50|nr:response regulator transcription factor [Sphingomonas bacterium]